MKIFKNKYSVFFCGKTLLNLYSIFGCLVLFLFTCKSKREKNCLELKINRYIGFLYFSFYKMCVFSSLRAVYLYSVNILVIFTTTLYFQNVIPHNLPDLPHDVLECSLQHECCLFWRNNPTRLCLINHFLFYYFVVMWSFKQTHTSPLFLYKQNYV